MPSLSALLYPASYLRYKTAVAASIFLEEVHVLAPSEDSIELVSEKDEINSMRVVPVVAAPLGEKLDDFKNGLKALETWGEQMGLGGNTGFETLYSALMGSQNEDIQGIIGAIKGGNKEDILMASRFFLRLSMDADQRMDQLDKELEQVEMDESRISQLVEGLSVHSREASTTFFIEPLNKAKERLRAWIRTFFAGGKVESSWPLGESISIKDIMDSAYESLSGGQPCVEVARFPMPFHPENSCDPNIPEKVRPAFSKLLDFLQERAMDKPFEVDTHEELTNLIKEIQQTLESDCKTSKRKGAAHMVVTIYPGHSWQEVLLKAAGLTEKDVDDCPFAPIFGSLFLM